MLKSISNSRRTRRFSHEEETATVGHQNLTTKWRIQGRITFHHGTQETLLPQTDRAMRCQSNKLTVNCYTTVQTSCTTNPQQIEVMNGRKAIL